MGNFVGFEIDTLRKLLRFSKIVNTHKDV